MLSRALIVGAFALMGLPFETPALAQKAELVKVSNSISTGSIATFVAIEKGIFEKRGIKVTSQLAQLVSLIPAAVQSESVEIGYATAPTVLQAIDSGLDLVIIAQGSVFNRELDGYAVIGAPNNTLSNPRDLVGKKVGVPGIGGFLDILFRDWLLTHGVDLKSLTYAEVGLPQMADVLRGRNVDAVVTADPVTERILSGGIGKTIANFTQEQPTGLPINYYFAKRAWAEANKETAKAFRESIHDAAQYIAANREEARAIFGRQSNLPPNVLSSIRIPAFDANATENGVRQWIEIMDRQKLLKGNINPKNLVSVAK